jgi:hypothetical protein
MAGALVGAVVPVQAQPPCCLAPDNGTGTATLPPQVPAGCIYLGSMEIVDGLPSGSTLQIAASIGAFTNVVEASGGALGGTQSNFDAFISMQMTGTGVYAAYNHFVSFPTQAGVAAWAPRINFAPVQTAGADMRVFQAQTLVDPDFDLLRVSAGTDFGMPSPGAVQLVSSGSSWAIASFFDLTWRIDFIGKPTGPFGGRSGSTTRQTRFSMCPENGVGVAGATWTAVKTLYTN